MRADPGAVPPDLVERVRARLLADPGRTGGRDTLSASHVAAALRAEGRPLGDHDVLSLAGALRSELAGAGPLEPLLRSPGVTDVLVNSPESVWWDRGAGLERAAVRFADEAAVRRLAQRLAASAGRRLDEASPSVDVRLADGTRMHALLAPVAVDGTTISFRVPPASAFTLEQLVGSGSLSVGLAQVLRLLVTSRRAFLVTGGTGTGKTTLLSTLLGLVDSAERLVLVEDSTELLPSHPHVVRLQARPDNVEGCGAVSVADLVRQSLRMRPDRLVVGEVRGAEVVDLLAALNTGHDGGCGTVHANAPHDLPARIEALGLAAGLGRQAVHSQLASAVHAVVHLVRRGPDRLVLGVWALTRDPVTALVHALPAYDADGRPSPGAERLDQLMEWVPGSPA